MSKSGRRTRKTHPAKLNSIDANYTVRRKMRPLLISVVVTAGVLAGCATASKEAANDFAGHYAMINGGFNEALNVELARDGSYVLDHELFACVIGPNGQMPITYSREEGTWKLEGGVVVLEPKAQTKDFPNAPVFVPALARGLIPKRDGFSRLLVNADFPEHLVLKKTKKPNRLLEPTSRSVTSPAGAGAAPLPAAAHR